MIVRNEQKHLERCLRSVKGVADQIVVVDTGSVDGTQEIARREGAELFEFPWVDDFSRARNYSLEQARAPWILILDADEQLLERDRQALGKLVHELGSEKGVPRIAFNLVMNHSADGGRSGMLARSVRLFPNHPEIRYGWPIHEQVETSLGRMSIQIKDTAIEILHDGYKEPARNREKQRRNLAILQKQIVSGEVFPLTFFLLGGACLDLGDYSGAMAAYEDCIRRAEPDDRFALGSKVRIDTCLYKLGRFSEVCARIGGKAEAQRIHPEQLVLRGNSLKALGDRGGAMETLRRVLAVEEAVFTPPCNLASVKLEAVLAIAALLKENGSEAAAVKLMRSAIEKRAAGQVLDLAWLSALVS